MNIVGDYFLGLEFTAVANICHFEFFAAALPSHTSLERNAVTVDSLIYGDCSTAGEIEDHVGQPALDGIGDFSRLRKISVNHASIPASD
jgi:hypothetical protein